MQKRITLEHISGYLPYDLTIRILNYKQDGVGVERSFVTGHYFLNGHMHLTYFGGSTGKSTSEFIPELRPLSSLTKEITHNGETFVPLVRLFEITYPKMVRGVKCNYSHVDTGRQICTYHDSSSFNLIFEKAVFKNTYTVIQKLYSWHYDIHGLIDAGLALPIND